MFIRVFHVPQVLKKKKKKKKKALVQKIIFFCLFCFEKLKKKKVGRFFEGRSGYDKQTIFFMPDVSGKRIQ